MTSILLETGSTPAFLDSNADGGLDVIGEDDSPNFIFVEGDGDDLIVGGDLKDIIRAGDGNDIVAGCDGDDIIDGGAGTDIIRGDAGNDVIRGGAGSDMIFGGEGDDVFDLRAEDFAEGEVDTILDFEAGADALRITGVSGQSVSYDASTGDVTVDGQVVAKVDDGLEIEATQVDEDTWELFQNI